MSLWSGLFIGAVALPGPDPVRRGGPLAGPVLRAADAARRRSGVPGDAVDLVLHAASGAADEEPITAEDVRRATGCHRATALDVRQSAGAGPLALHLASRYLSASPQMRAALVTAADGATVLTTGPGVGAGVARVLATTAGEGAAEGALFRSDLAWRVPEPPRGGRESGPARPARIGCRDQEVVTRTLAEAGLRAADVARFVPCVRTASPAGVLAGGGLRARDKVVLAGDGREGSLGCAVLEVV